MGSGEKGDRWIEPRFSPLTVGVKPPFLTLGDGRIMAMQGNATVTSRDGGNTWSEPRVIYGEGGLGVSDKGPGIPQTGVFVRTREGVIILVWKDECDLNWNDTIGEPGPDARGQQWSIRSCDDGQTWIDRQPMCDGMGGQPPTNIIQTMSGRLVTTVQYYLRKPGRNVLRGFSSPDNGKTWRGSNIIDLGGHGHHDGAVEPTLVQLKDGRLWMLIRTNWDRFWDAFSDDDGLSWRTIVPGAIEGSTSPAYLTRLSSGRLILLWNRLYPEGASSFARRSGQYSEAMASWHREELSLAFSEDEGATWSKPVIIAREKDTWVSYPYVFEPQPGLLWIFTAQGNLSVRVREADLIH
jgi:sialidase-1